MVEPVEKSTLTDDASRPQPVREKVLETASETMWLDARLVLFFEQANTLVLSDLHFGYEVSQRAKGGLWPLWGRQSICERVDALLKDYQPDRLILNGDVIDGADAGTGEAKEWLKTLRSGERELILISGNHDPAALTREFGFVDHFEMGDFLFHHGHLDLTMPSACQWEVIGHHHPAVRLHDGAGLSLKMPCLARSGSRWILPAFSPWAGGGTIAVGDHETETTCWSCGCGRILKI